MELAAAGAVLDEPGGGEHDLLAGVAVGVLREDVLTELGEADPPDRGEGAVEAELDHLAAEAVGLEDLGPPVGVDGGDAHLGHDLEDAVLGGGLEAVQRLRGRQALHETLACPIGDVGQRQPRADEVGAVADQACEVMGFAGLAAVHDDRRPGAQSGTDEPVVHGSGGQQRRDGGPVRTEEAVGDHEDPAPGRHGFLGLLAEAPDGVFESLRAVGHGHGGIEERGGPRRVHEQVVHGRGVHEEGVELEEIGGLRLLGEQRAAWTDEGPHRHHEAFAQVVDRRVGDLGEALLEEVEQRTRYVGEEGGRGVVAHRRGRLLAELRHGLQDDRDLLLGDPEGRLPGGQVIGDRDRGLAGARATEPLGPLGVGPQPGELALDGAVVLDRFGQRGVDAQHLSGAELAALHGAVAVHVDRAGLGRDDHEAVVADLVAQRAEAVAVEGRAHAHAVGEDQPRGSVPRLDQARMVAVEAPEVVVEVVSVLPELGDEHARGVSDVPAPADEQLEGVVEHRRIRPLGVDHGMQQLVGCEVPLAEVGRAGAHQIHVALDRVDLAVVAQEPEGLGALPVGGRVGRVALVEDRERGLEAIVGEVEVEVAELRRRGQRLVGDGAERPRRDVQAKAPPQPLPFGPAARPEAAPLPLFGVVGIGGEQELRDAGHDAAGDLTEGRGVEGDLAPLEVVQAFGAGSLLHDRTDLAVALGEDHRHPSVPEDPRRDGGQDPRTVARQGVGGDGAPVHDPAQGAGGGLDDGARGPPAGVGDEADAAGVPFPSRVVTVCTDVVQGPHGLPHLRGLSCRQSENGARTHKACEAPLLLRLGYRAWAPDASAAPQAQRTL